MKNLIAFILCFVAVCFLTTCTSDNELQKNPSSQFKPFILKNADEDALTAIPADVIPSIHSDLISKGKIEEASNFLKTYDKVTGKLLVPLEESIKTQSSSGRTASGESLTIRASIQNRGWVWYKNAYNIPAGWVTATVGTTGQNRYMEAFIIDFKGGTSNVQTSYRAHVAGIGWQLVAPNGGVAGTVGEHRAIEAISFNFRDSVGGTVYIFSRARAHVSGIGWMPWVDSSVGLNIGTTGQHRNLEAFQLEIYISQ